MFGKAFGYGSGMRRLLASGALVGALATAVAAAAQEQPTPAPTVPTFRSGIELVSVGATVRDRKGRLVQGLQARDFVVLERGQERSITNFEVDRAPVSVAILFDVSGSMQLGDRTSAARFAAYQVLSSLEPGRDEAGLFAFDSRLREVAPFTVDTRALQGALGEVDPFGATSLHDAIAATARRVSEREGRRRAVIVLTDGIDTSSKLSPSQVSGIASAIDVPVYVIATVMPLDNPELNGEEGVDDQPAASGTVKDLANWTGGTLFYASTAPDTARTAKQVLNELRHQYVLGFEPVGGNGWRPLEVRTRQKNHVVRARSGYLAGDARLSQGR